METETGLGNNRPGSVEPVIPEIPSVSGNRFWKEFSEIIQSKSKAIRMLDYFGYLETILPEIHKMKGVIQNEHHLEGSVWIHTLLVLDSCKSTDPLVLLACLLHDTGKVDTYSCKEHSFPDNLFKHWDMIDTCPEEVHFYYHENYSAKHAENICERFKLSKEDKELVVWLCQNHMRIGYLPIMKKSKQAALFADPRFPKLFEVHYADNEGSVNVGNTPEVRKSHMENIWGLYEDFLNYFPEPKAINNQLKEMGIDGATIMERFNLGQCKLVGELLSAAKEYLYDFPEVEAQDIWEHLERMKD